MKNNTLDHIEKVFEAEQRVVRAAKKWAEHGDRCAYPELGKAVDALVRLERWKPKRRVKN